MRRTTLGAASANSSRNAGGAPPGRALGHMGAQHPADRRGSALPLGGGRRSSVMSATGRPGSISSRRSTMQFSARKGDPRPTSDRQFMAFCIKNLISFVIERGYDEPISPKILTNPTSRDFQNIFSFLLLRCAPFSFQKRFEEDIPIVLKFLGYPFTLSKSALTAVGSPHTWPTLLGVLSWLCELLKYGEAAEAKRANIPQSSATERQRLFHEDLMKSYGDFLEGCDEFSELDKELELKFEERSAKQRHEIEVLLGNVKERELKLTELRSNPSPLQETSECRQALESNIKKFNMLIPHLLENLEKVQSGVSTRNNEVSEQNEKLAALSEEDKRVSDIIEVQKKNSINAQEIVNKRTELRRALDQTSEERNVAEKDVRFSAEDLDQYTAEFKDLLREYQKNVHHLSSIPGAMRSAKGVDFRVQLNEDESVTQADKILSSDLDRTITPALLDLNNVFGEDFLELKEKDLKLQDMLDDMELKQVQKREHIAALKSEYSSDEQVFQEEKERLAEERKKRQESNIANEKQLSARRKEEAERLNECQRREDFLIVQLKNMERQFEDEKRRVAALILEDIKVIRERKQKMQRLINNVGDAGRAAVEAPAGLPPTMPKKP